MSTDTEIKIVDIIVRVLLNLFVVFLAVSLYSPGLIALRPTDESILRAGFSIICVPLLLCMFCYINRDFIKKKSIVVYQGRAVVMDASLGDKILRLKDLVSFLRTKHVYRFNVMTHLADQCLNSAVLICSRVENYTYANYQEKRAALRDLDAKMGFYIDALYETIQCCVNLARYWSGSDVDIRDFDDLYDTLSTIDGIFTWMRDTAFERMHSDISSDQTMIKVRAELDGYIDHVVHDLANKYK